MSGNQQGHPKPSLARRDDVEDGVERRAFLRAPLRWLPLLPFANALTRSLHALPRVKGLIPFVDEAGSATGELIGSGPDVRMAFDLARLAEEGLVVANRDFFIHTAAPEGIGERSAKTGDTGPEEWSVRFDAGAEASGHFRDFGGAVTDITVDELRDQSRPRGVHLVECADNGADHQFGLIGACEWSGVLLKALFGSAFGNTSRRMLVRVTGMGGGPASESEANSAGSADGVSDTKASPQMLEYASRTHQEGRPELAREFHVAEVDFAAMPILVEELGDGGYLVTGIAWGNAEGVEGLKIRFPREGEAEAPWVEVESFTLPPPSAWSLWRHRYQLLVSGKPAEVEISLRAVVEPTSRTTRLESGHYARRIAI